MFYRKPKKCRLHKKSIFPDRIAAELALTTMRDNREKLPCQAYLDPACGYWHVTSRKTWTERPEGAQGWAR